MVLVPIEITKIGIMKNLNGRQGPCDRGFHVPTKEEMVSLYNMGISLGAWSSTSPNGMISYLYFPLSGYRDSNSTVKVQGYSGWLLSCSPSDDEDYPDYSPGWLYNSTLNINSFSIVARCNGYPIRPFKDTPVIPDSSWTVNYQGTGSAGIYYNSTDKIISISDDGENWITIADRNLGATSNNTSSNTSYGLYYQWGNNHGFPTTGTVTTSSTQVDASNYGPGNYYDSSTFITRTSEPRGWDSSRNDNLRGGENPNYLGEVEIKKVCVMKQGSDMQGPCPSGFHIPTSTELETLANILDVRGFKNKYGGDFCKTYLKIPFAGDRGYYNGSVADQNTSGLYWSCTSYSNYQQGYSLAISSNSFSRSSTTLKNYGLSIRPFKDEAVIPDSSWTKTFNGSGTAGVYHNSTLGLISLSSDGTNWLTIADKNCGATTVYNSGDTLSEANCGKYYQRGNCYGFPRTGSITTSSTKVDATNYGPGNYYNSSNFIIATSSPYYWDTGDNRNLRGGVTQQMGLQEEIIFETTPVYDPVWDYVLNNTSYTGGLSSYWYGLKIIPKVNCTLNKIRFVADANMNGWTLKITDSNFSATGTTYTVSGATGGVYTLPTPFQMTAGTTYAVGLQSSSGGYYYNYNPGYPLSGTNVTFKCGLNGYNNSEQNVIYNIRGVETTQTS